MHDAHLVRGAKSADHLPRQRQRTQTSSLPSVASRRARSVPWTNGIVMDPHAVVAQVVDADDVGVGHSSRQHELALELVLQLLRAAEPDPNPAR